MKTIKINKENYIGFNDYNNLMVEALGIGCSICQNPEITFIINTAPTPIGRFLKEQGQDFSDQQIETIIQIPLQLWQELEDQNFSKQIPTFVCDECWNTF